MFYAQNGNPEESARLAGYANPQKDGSLLLIREDIAEYMNSLYKQNGQYLSQKAVSGYERLAFGNVTDAVRLMFADDPDMSSIASLDLFNVAEIKRPKDGALEIKFFDRIKALEKLESADKEETSSVSEFYKALADCGSSENGKGGQCEIQEIF